MRWLLICCLYYNYANYQTYYDIFLGAFILLIFLAIYELSSWIDFGHDRTKGGWSRHAGCLSYLSLWNCRIIIIWCNYEDWITMYYKLCTNVLVWKKKVVLNRRFRFCAKKSDFIPLWGVRQRVFFLLFFLNSWGLNIFSIFWNSFFFVSKN